MVRLTWLLMLAAAPAAHAADNLLFFKRLEAFETEQVRKGAELHLSQSELKERYPPPELDHVPVLRAKPGAVVDIQVPGRIPEGSFVGINCEQLEILSFEQSAAGVRAKVRLPVSLDRMVRRSCELLACGPITNALVAVPVIQVAVKYVWSLNLSNGMRVSGTAVFDGDRLERHAVWEHHGNSAGEHNAPFTTWRPGDLSLYVDRTPEDENASAAAWDAAPERKERDDLWTELSQLRRAARAECGDRSDCQAQYEGRMRAAFRKLPRLQERERELFHRHPTACDELLLAVTPDHRVRGKAYACANAKVADVEGNVTEEGL